MATNGASQATPNPILADAVDAAKKAFAAVAVFSIGINLLMLTAPVYMLQVFDRVITSRNTDTLLALMLVAGFALMIMATLESVRSLALVRIAAWLDRVLGAPILTESVSATLHARQDPTVQGLRDLSTVRGFLSGAGIFPVMDAPWTPIFLAVMFILHPALGWLAMAGAAVLFALALANEFATRDLLKRAGGASIQAMGEAEAAVRNADAIQAMGMMPGLLGRWNQRNAQSIALQSRASVRSGHITAVSKFIRLVLQIGILSLGAWLVIAGELTPGAMIAGSILMGRALAPVEQAIGAWKQMIAARDSFDRIKERLDAAPAGRPGMPLPAPKGEVRADGVVYAHPGAAEPQLRNINFAIEPGEAVGVIGPTAVGKTTLARLLVGNLKPRLGHVRLDGMDIAEWDADDRGRHVGYLPQDVELFGGTISENIARMAEPDPEMVVAAARLAGVHEMILSMAKGYDTEIGAGGAALSGGQRQRIALARAVYGEPRFLVLDEPNASLDGDGEAALVQAIAALRERGASVVVISHRPTILNDVDKILVLRAGTVETFGPRAAVMAQLMQTGAAKPASRPAPRANDDAPAPIPRPAGVDHANMGASR